MRKQQLNKIYKHYSKNYLVHKVYNLGYYFDYDCELLEYSHRNVYSFQRIQKIIDIIEY